MGGRMKRCWVGWGIVYVAPGPNRDNGPRGVGCFYNDMTSFAFTLFSACLRLWEPIACLVG